MYKYGKSVSLSTPTTGSDAAGCAVTSASRALFVQGASIRHSNGQRSNSTTGTQRHMQQPPKHAQPGPPWPHQPEGAWACSPPCFSDLTREDLHELWSYTRSFPTSCELLPKQQDIPEGCESEVEQQQLLCLANMLQSRALQSHPNAPHRYSLPPAQLQSIHHNPPGGSMHPRPPGGSSAAELAPGSPRADPAIRQARASPSMSHPAAISHTHSQQGRPACYVEDQLQPQHGDPTLPMMSEQQQRSLLKDCQDAHAAGLHARGCNPHQVCYDDGQSSGSHPYSSSYKAGQGSQQSRAYVAQAAGHSSLPQVHHQPFHPTVSRLSPSRRPQSTAQPVLRYQNPKACGRGTMQQQGTWPGSKLGANQSHGSKLGANQLHGSELGANQPHGCRASRLKPQQPRQSVTLGLKRKLAGSASSSANDSALPHDPQPCDTPTVDAGQFQEKENNPTFAVGSQVRTSGSRLSVPDTVSSPALPSVLDSSTAAIGLTSDRPNRCLPVETATTAVEEIDLLADPADELMLSTDLSDDPDDHAGSVGFLLGSHHDLPDDPLEGLCVPSWQELLNEAVSQFTPQGPLKTHPGDPGVTPHACPVTQGSLEGCSWDCPALSESPAQKRRKPGDCGATQGLTRSLSWDHLQDQEQANSIGSQRSAACGMAAVAKSDSAMRLEDAQSKAHASSAEHATQSDKLSQDLQQMMMMEISSAVEAQQASVHKQKPAAVQKRRGGAAKHAKRAGGSSKAKGKRSQQQGRGHAPEQPQGEGQGRQQRPQGPSLGKLLPFDSLKGSGAGGEMAELNSRIQATAAQPSPAVKDLPLPSKPPSAVARPVATFSSAQHSAHLHSGSESPHLVTLLVSHGRLQVQSDSGYDRTQHTVKCTPNCTAAASSSGAIQLVKLSGASSGI